MLHRYCKGVTDTADPSHWTNGQMQRASMREEQKLRQTTNSEGPCIRNNVRMGVPKACYKQPLTTG